MLSEDPATFPVIGGQRVAWTEAPNDQHAGWTIQTRDISAGAATTTLVESTSALKTEGIVGGDAVIYTQKTDTGANELYLVEPIP